MGFKICSDSDDWRQKKQECDSAFAPVTSAKDPGDDAQQAHQEYSAGAGAFAKWFFIVLCGSGIVFGGPVGALFIFALLLLTYTGASHQGGNDARKK
jgi:hypothetical protein